MSEKRKYGTGQQKLGKGNQRPVHKNSLSVNPIKRGMQSRRAPTPHVIAISKCGGNLSFVQ